MATNDIFLYAGEASPNDIKLRDPTVPDAGSPVAYALTCDVGAYVYSGVAVTLTVERRLPLAAGAYVYVGQAATFTVARGLQLAAGAYVYAGQDAALTIGRGLVLDAGAYAYAGQDAALDYVPGSPPPMPAVGLPHVHYDVELVGQRKRKKLNPLLLLLR